MFFERISEDIPEVSHKRTQLPNQSVYFNHIHRHCELLLFVTGEAEYNIDGRAFRPSPLDLLCIPAATYHYLIPSSGVPYENYVIGIRPERLPEEQYRRIFSPPFMISIGEDSELHGFFTRLDRYRALYTPRDFCVCCEALIGELFTYLAYRKGELESVHSRGTAYIDRIVRFIAEHLHEELDAEIISRHFLLSRSYVQNMFSSHMHIGLKKYVQQKKIYAAHADIARGMSPREACESYAFGDYSSFYRLYRQTFDTSPRGRR